MVLLKKMLALFKRANEQCLCSKFIVNIGENANVTCVTSTNDVRNNRITVAFQKWDLVPSQNRSLFNYSIQIEYENQ